MCGVCGFMSGYAGKPDQATFETVVADTATRGNHAWGIAWVDDKNRLRHYKQDGDVRNNMKRAWAMVRNAKAFILHTRWSTHGKGNNNNHPHALDGGWLIHNGVVSNYEKLKREKQYWLVSECDTEIICRLADLATGRLPDRMKTAIDQTTGNLVIATLWHNPERLVLARRGNPLWVGRGDDGLWFSSYGRGIAYAAEVSHDTLLEYRYRAGLPMVYRKRALDATVNVSYSRGGSYDPSGRLITSSHMSGTDFRHRGYEQEAVRRIPQLTTRVIRPNRVTDDEPKTMADVLDDAHDLFSQTEAENQSQDYYGIPEWTQ